MNPPLCSTFVHPFTFTVVAHTCSLLSRVLPNTTTKKKNDSSNRPTEVHQRWYHRMLNVPSFKQLTLFMDKYPSDKDTSSYQLPRKVEDLIQLKPVNLIVLLQPQPKWWVIVFKRQPELLKKYLNAPANIKADPTFHPLRRHHTWQSLETTGATTSPRSTLKMVGPLLSISNGPSRTSWITRLIL